MNDLKAYILVGLPGSGKSTFVNNQSDCPVISSDRYIQEYADRIGKTYNEVFYDYIKIATAEMNEYFQRCINLKVSFYWDQTNLSKKKRAEILKKIPENYDKIAIVFDIVDENVWRDRLNSREGKTISSYTIESMIKSYSAPSYDEGFDKIIHIKTCHENEKFLKGDCIV